MWEDKRFNSFKWIPFPFHVLSLSFFLKTFFVTGTLYEHLVILISWSSLSSLSSWYETWLIIFISFWLSCHGQKMFKGNTRIIRLLFFPVMMIIHPSFHLLFSQELLSSWEKLFCLLFYLLLVVLFLPWVNSSSSFPLFWLKLQYLSFLVLLNLINNLQWNERGSDIRQ